VRAHARSSCQVQQYHGVSEHFERDFEVSDAVKAELQQALGGRVPRGHSGELESYIAPAKKAPIRWEPHIDENAQAAYPVEATPHSTPHKSGGHGVVAVLREQLDAERDRTEQVQVRPHDRLVPPTSLARASHRLPAYRGQERLDAALAAASEANTRAARAEAKLEMTQQIMSKLEAKAGKA